mmetsp:Transcript_6399/g.21563  ORF Transcript_6399/g.21563 Transcript_6399/m.21563 type:complete len:302 (-) Transcript_6399:612-1517(-)
MRVLSHSSARTACSRRAGSHCTTKSNTRMSFEPSLNPRRRRDASAFAPLVPRRVSSSSPKTSLTPSREIFNRRARVAAGLALRRMRRRDATRIEPSNANLKTSACACVMTTTTTTTTALMTAYVEANVKDGCSGTSEAPSRARIHRPRGTRLPVPARRNALYAYHIYNTTTLIHLGRGNGEHHHRRLPTRRHAHGFPSSAIQQRLRFPSRERFRARRVDVKTRVVGCLFAKILIRLIHRKRRREIDGRQTVVVRLARHHDTLLNLRTEPRVLDGAGPRPPMSRRRLAPPRRRRRPSRVHVG